MMSMNLYVASESEMIFANDYGLDEKEYCLGDA